MNLHEGVPLSKYTTLGTGGPARRFGSPGTVDELVEMLAWARGADQSRLHRGRSAAHQRGRDAVQGAVQAGSAEIGAQPALGGGVGDDPVRCGPPQPEQLREHGAARRVPRVVDR